ncbi:Leucine-rich repeat, ribonuclease inhibitor subtype [Phytophthora cinnamomi]|uniref:Leucine-rich repeat, ribonuclease inhibitor subtype n=1 Tax=Phytophthora cinnamomi TaxID=4785 RepID=UPI003559E106|nr:Leucine-rich repeat, ribonuclease inhibitor subtype [Phytophthora cinnamomi]
MDMQAQVMMTPPTTPTGSVAQAPQWAPERCNAKRIDSSTTKAQQDTAQQIGTQIQNQWQCSSHLPERRMMVQRILQLSQSQTKPNVQVNPERAVLLAKRIELALYSRAGSLAEYCNLATLRRRLQSLVASSVHEAAATETVVQVQSRKRRVVARNLLHVTSRAIKRQRCTSSTTASCSIFASIGEDCTRLVFSFLDGKEVVRHRALNRFAASFLPTCVLSVTVEVAQLTQGLAQNSSMLKMVNLQQLVVHKAGAMSLSPVVPKVGSASTPLYAWGCAELPTTQSNDGESAVLALAGAFTSGAFPNIKKLQLISVFVNTMSRNALRSLCNALESGCCPLLEDLLLAGNSLADLGASEVARLLQSAQAPRLTRLDLRRNFIGETGLRAVLGALAQSTDTPSLQVLCMGGNLVTDNCVTELQSLLGGAVCPSLRFLGLEDNFLSSEGVKFVLDSAAVTSSRARRVSCDRDANSSA